MIVGVIGLVINVIGLFMFGGGHGHSHGGDDDRAHEHSQEVADSDDYSDGGSSSVEAWLPDGYSQIFRLYVFGPLGLKDYGSARLRCKI